MKSNSTIVRLGLVLVAGVLAAATSACSPGVPDNPTWTEDVKPILMANCARCHTVPAIGGAPDYLRLDTYDDWPRDDGQDMRAGAASLAPFIKLVATGDDASMPPISPLTDRQQEILTLWAEQGAPRGEPLPGNAPPDMDMGSGNLSGDNSSVYFNYEIRDSDGDFVVGMLTAEGAIGTETITYELHSGPGIVSWDLSAVPPGDYELTAELDDGNARYPTDLGTFTVPGVVPNPLTTPAPAPRPLFAGE